MLTGTLKEGIVPAKKRSLSLQHF